MSEPPTPDEVQDAFSSALRRDAAASPPEIPPPPRLAVSVDPQAPHGRDETGAPLTPHGVKSDGSPRLKPPGPGRGHRRDTEPRVRPAPRHAAPAAPGSPASSGSPAPAGDYTEQLAGLGYSAWMAAASCKGGRFLSLTVPDLRPFAHAFHDSLPGMIGAWNTAANQNEKVRGYVERLAGEGSWSWVLAVAFATSPFVSACAQLRQDTPAAAQLRADFAAKSDAELKAFLVKQFGQPGDENDGGDQAVADGGGGQPPALASVAA